MLERNLGPLCLAIGIRQCGAELELGGHDGPCEGTTHTSAGHKPVLVWSSRLWRNAQEVCTTVSGVAGAAWFTLRTQTDV